MNGQDKILQYTSSENNGIRYSYNMKGNKVELSVYSENQYKYKKHMPEPVKLDTAKSIISPMPGSIVSTSVKPGDSVVDGQ